MAKLWDKAAKAGEEAGFFARLFGKSEATIAKEAAEAAKNTRVEPVLNEATQAAKDAVKPKLSAEETKAFLKAQEEAKAAKEAAEKAKPLDFTPSDTPGMVIQKSGEKAGSASAKAAEAKAAEEGSAGLKWI